MIKVILMISALLVVHLIGAYFGDRTGYELDIILLILLDNKLNELQK